MADKQYPAWHYFLAGGIALLFGLGLLLTGGWLYGALFTLIGVAAGVVGLTKLGKQPAPSP